jgi:hypothetical protein
MRERKLHRRAMCFHSRVLPSMSLNRNVTVPVGNKRFAGGADMDGDWNGSGSAFCEAAAGRASGATELAIVLASLPTLGIATRLHAARSLLRMGVKLCRFAPRPAAFAR